MGQAALAALVKLALAALLALAGLALWQRAQLAAARSELATITRDLADARAIQAQAEEAAAVHRAHVARMQRETEAWADLTRNLQEMEGRDAPLSDHLRAVAGRLWP
jgi:hypothetical protein